MTSNSKAEGRFGKQDFRQVAEEERPNAEEQLKQAGLRVGAVATERLPKALRER